MNKKYLHNNPFKLNHKLKEKFGTERYKSEPEHFISRYIWRKITLPITYMLSKTKITANQISILGFLFGIGAAIFYSFAEWKFLVLGSIFLICYSIFDHVDGEIARLKKQVSIKGFFYDHFTGTFKDFFIILGLTVGYYKQSQSIMVWYYGFVILGAWMLTSDFISHLKIGLSRVNEKLIGSKQIKLLNKTKNVDLNKIKSIYSVVFSGLTRGFLVILLTLLNQVSILFVLLLCLGISHVLITIYIVKKRIA